MTANLQARITVKQAAELMNVSARLIHMGKVVRRLRPDLADKVEVGEMSMNEAHRIATGKAKETSWDRLVRAWNNATDDDRTAVELTAVCMGRVRDTVAAGEPVTASMLTVTASCLGKLGATPTDRAKINIPAKPDAEVNPFAQFLEQ